jgi:Ca2+-binding RTX toxin-like protein
VPDLKGASVQENAAAGTAIGELSAQDPNPGDGLRFDLVDTAGGRFALEGSKLVVAAGARLDYEQSATHSIVVRVTDDGGIAHDRSFTIQVGDVDVERIYGTAGKDALTGTGGREILYGFMGKDTLTGGTGQDTFVFDSRPHKTRNADTITDFNVNDDGIWLENKVFAKLGKKGTEMNPAQLKKSFFTIGDKAKDQNDYIVYNKAKGVLYYDADGSGSRYKQVEIATLSKKLKMTHKDFFVI